MKQSVVLTGLGEPQFETAIRGMLSIYQVFQGLVATLQGRLREWAPTQNSADLELKFHNRLLTRMKDIGDDIEVDMAQVIDPFNVLRPLLRDQVHTTDNVVEYWERNVKDSKCVFNICGCC